MKDVIINIDVLEGLKSLKDCSVQCCVTSPPYYGLRDYGHAGQIGLEKTPGIALKKDDYEYPPSNRAFGFVSVKAVRSGLIKQVGIKKVRNPIAHCANSALWQRI